MPTIPPNQSFILSLLSIGLAALVFPVSIRADEIPPDPSSAKLASTSPWGFNLSTYLWLPGIDGNFTAGSHSGSVDASFIDIVGKSRRIPLGFMGRFEAHYERFGFFLDGNYMNIKLEPSPERITQGIDSEIGIMDYGLTYRVVGATAAKMPGLVGKKRPNALDVYAGARTIWLGNGVTFSGPAGLIERTPSTSNSFTSPIIGGRIIVDFTPNWFVLADGNFGGFGAQRVDFTGSIMGMLGYRTTFFDIPASVEAGYKAIRYRVDKGGPTATSATLNGPFIGLTGYW